MHTFYEKLYINNIFHYITSNYITEYKMGFYGHNIRWKRGDNMRVKLSILSLIVLISTSFIINEERFLKFMVTMLGGQVVEKGMKIEISDIKVNDAEDLFRNIEQYKEENGIKLNIDDEFLGTQGKVYINVESEGDYIKLYQINNNILRFINTKHNNISTYYFIKGKLEDNNLITYSNKLRLFLQVIGSNNIKTVDDKAIYGTAFTGFFKNEVISNEKVDLNFSVNQYTSGTYVTIGTPIIACSY